MSDLDRIGEVSPKRVDKIAEEEETAIIADSKKKNKGQQRKELVLNRHYDCFYIINHLPYSS